MIGLVFLLWKGYTPHWGPCSPLIRLLAPDQNQPLQSLQLEESHFIPHPHPVTRVYSPLDQRPGVRRSLHLFHILAFLLFNPKPLKHRSFILRQGCILAFTCLAFGYGQFLTLEGYLTVSFIPIIREEQFHCLRLRATFYRYRLPRENHTKSPKLRVGSIIIKKTRKEIGITSDIFFMVLS